MNKARWNSSVSSFPTSISGFLVLILIVSAASTNTPDTDFEFDDHHQEDIPKVEGPKKTWILDQGSDLCRVLKCKKKEICLLEDEYTAVCINKKDTHINGNQILPKSEFVKKLRGVEDSKEYDGDDSDSDYYEEDDYDEDIHQTTTQRTCTSCPMISKPVVFLCGSDNRTYSSACRLNYHNCVHQTNVTLSCPGFCPCRGMSSLDEKLKVKRRYTEDKKMYKEDNAKNGIPEVKTFNGIPQPPDVIKYKEYSKIPKKVSFEKLRSYNDVVKGSGSESLRFDCSKEGLDSIGNRLLDWFSVIMSSTSSRKEKGKTNRKSSRRGKNGWTMGSWTCKPEVTWMFDHLNQNGDHSLSFQELATIRNDHNEKCIRPFLDQCDTDGDLSLNGMEWCNCFQMSNPPCTAIREHVKTGLLGGYVPDCDAAGFYKLIQCHSSIGLCWCVDRHGIEFPSTRTRGKPNCGGASEENTTEANDRRRDSTENIDDEDDTEGSGESALLEE